MVHKAIDPYPIIEKLLDRRLTAKGIERSILGEAIDILRAAPDVCLEWIPGTENEAIGKLKPCPFCGGEAEIVTNGELTKSKYYFVDVQCKNTRCRGWSSVLDSRTRKQAIEAWNRRAEDGK